MRRSRIIVGVLLTVAAAVGYGVYWWHESAMEVEDPLKGVEPDDRNLIEITKILKDASRVEEAKARLEALPSDKRLLVLLTLAREKAPMLRRFAAAGLATLRDEPRARAVLANLAHSDPDPKVKEAAASALDGRAEWPKE